MKYLTFVRHSESYRHSPPPPALMAAMRWPGFEGESEVRPMFEPGMGP
jgi:hypothetical protein